MKSIGQVLQTAPVGNPEVAKAKNQVYVHLLANRDAPNSSPMDAVFESLDVMYPHQWRAAYPTMADRQIWATVWAERFADEMLTADQIKLALRQIDKVATRGFIPSLADFIRATKPLLNYEGAYNLALRQWIERYTPSGKEEWSNPKLAPITDRIIFAAVSLMQPEVEAGTPYAKIKNRWNDLIDELLETPDLPAIPQAHHKRITNQIEPASREFALSKISELKKLFGSVTDPKTDRNEKYQAMMDEIRNRQRNLQWPDPHTQVNLMDQANINKIPTEIWFREFESRHLAIDRTKPSADILERRLLDEYDKRVEKAVKEYVPILEKRRIWGEANRKNKKHRAFLLERFKHAPERFKRALEAGLKVRMKEQQA